MDTSKRWQDRLTFLLGLWLFISPALYTPSFTLNPMTGNTILMSLLVMFFSAAAITRYRPWEEWVEAVIGAWLIISPFAFGATDLSLATLNHIVVGAIIMVDSVWVAWKYPSSSHLAH